MAGDITPERAAFLTVNRVHSYNRWLPYAADLPAEAEANFAAIKHGFAQVIAQRDLLPGIKFWSSRLLDHLKLYKFHFSLAEHVALVQLLFQVFLTPNQDYGVQERLAGVLRRLIRSVS